MLGRVSRPSYCTGLPQQALYCSNTGQHRLAASPRSTRRRRWPNCRRWMSCWLLCEGRPRRRRRPGSRHEMLARARPRGVGPRHAVSSAVLNATSLMARAAERVESPTLIDGANPRPGKCTPIRCRTEPRAVRCGGCGLLPHGGLQTSAEQRHKVVPTVKAFVTVGPSGGWRQTSSPFCVVAPNRFCVYTRIKKLGGPRPLGGHGDGNGDSLAKIGC